MKIKVFSVLSIAFLVFVFSNSALVATEKTPLQAELQKRANSYFLRGAAVGLIAKSAPPALTLFGDARSESDLFEIGSISKTLTGITTARLAIEKKIDLETPITKYIPELTGTFVGTVTAHQLALHTAQLPSGFTDPAGNDSVNYSEAQLLVFLKNYTPDPVLFPPGQSQYSNVGFATLGLLISRVEKKSFTQVIQTQILNPLAMKGSGFLTTPEAPQGLLQGYHVLQDASHYYPLSDLASAAGGVYSNLHDMMIYLKINLHPDSSLMGQAIQLSQKLALGWDSDPGALPIWKNGAMNAGFSSMIQLDPNLGTGVIVLNNTRNPGMTISLANVAMYGSDPGILPKEFNEVPASVIQSSVGTFKTTDQKTTLKIAAFHDHYLGGELITDDHYPIRLFSTQPNILMIDDSDQVVNFIETKKGPLGDELIYNEAQGTDSQQKPIYKKSPLQRE